MREHVKNNIVLSYCKEDPITGLSNSVYTTIPGTKVKLPSGKYRVSGSTRLEVDRGATDGGTTDLQIRVDVDGSQYYPGLKWYAQDQGQNQIDMNATIGHDYILELGATSTVELKAFIAATGTVTTRDVVQCSFIIERIS